MVYPALKVDIQTGMMDKGSALGILSFDVQRKLKFIELATQWWPDMSRCCREIGIHYQTYLNHIKSDVKFCEAIRSIKTSKLDEIEAVSAESARDQRRGFLDRAMILRAHRPELYDRAKVVKIEGYKMGQGEARQRLAGLEGAIDAEIVKTYSDRKQRREARQQARLKASEDRAGKGGEVGA